MNMGFLLFCAPNTAFRRAAGRRLQALVPDKSVQVWRSTRTWQSRLAPKRPRHSASVNFMMRYFEWSCALYRALQEHGMSRADAAALVGAVMSDVYQPVSTAWFKLSRVRSAKRETRVKWLLGMMTRHFFSSPFRHRHLPSETGVAFDVTLCPLANYFKDQGVPELTPHAACNLDHCAARAFGVDLVRSQTIADGSAHCDFRWKFPTHGEQPQKAEKAVSV
ncbi:MAG: L-2-amino-thiazoline-4-carboxylic acid hydrolase [Acidobacteriota bacterium]|nr:L-2-amino-thiazoline-4-carboxylic acid hydrolase [Acidobacteriota bacterium]